MKGKNINVEVIRIIASMLVIGIHLTTGHKMGNRVIISRLYMDSILCDSVIYFWFIMGFFLFNGKKLKDIYKKAIRHIIFPAIVVILVTQFFSGWILGTKSIIECIQSPTMDWKNMITQTLNWSSSGFVLAPHLWYIFTYFLILLWFPIIKPICTDEKKKVRIYIYIICALYLLNSAIQMFGAFPSVIQNLIPVALVEVILGYDIYNYCEKKGKSRRMILMGFFLFFGSNIVRVIVQYALYLHSPENGYFMCWNTFPSLFAGTGLTVAILSMDFKKKNEKIISFLADKTYGIYLIHWSVIAKSGKIFTLISNIMNVESGTGISAVLYELLSIAYVFCMSGLIVWFSGAIWKILKKLGISLMKKINVYSLKCKS